MTREEFKLFLNNVHVDNILINCVEEKYGMITNEIVKKVISYNENDMFIGAWRVVSKQEILNSIEEIHVDFLEEKIIPIFDIGDNDFICFSIETNKWVCFNIIDKIIFAEKNDILDYLEE